MTGQPDSPAGLSFERDIRPMFRERGRDSMLKAFDLWISPDVPVRGFIYDVKTGRLSELFPDQETATG